MKTCSICNAGIEGENPPVLAIGHYGNPRYLCETCAGRLDTVTLGREPEEIRRAMDQISADILKTGTEDSVVTDTVNEIFTAAGERAEKILAGEYDFSEDEQTEETDTENEDTAEGEFDIPDELRESEEDAELDRQEEEAEKKFDKVLNALWYGVGLIFIAGLVYWFFFR